MTHTEESLMALVSGFVQASCDRGFTPDVTWDDVRQNERALRLAIREVLAERDALKETQRKFGVVQEQLFACAEKAEAERDRAIGRSEYWKAKHLAAETECERLSKDAERYRWLHTPGQQQDFVCGVAWDSPEEMDAAIDAAIQSERKNAR